MNGIMRTIRISRIANTGSPIGCCGEASDNSPATRVAAYAALNSTVPAADAIPSLRALAVKVRAMVAVLFCGCSICPGKHAAGRRMSGAHSLYNRYATAGSGNAILRFGTDWVDRRHSVMALVRRAAAARRQRLY